jgi:hypothetical protein
MTRKTLVNAISIIYMVLGLLNFSTALFPTFSSSGLFVIKLFPLVGGALALYAGLAMLRLSDFGRQFVIILLSIRVLTNVWALFYLKGGAWLGLNYLGEQIYRIENRYAYPVFLLVWMVVALLTITFLSQRETKTIFTQETADGVDSGEKKSDGIEVESDILI